MGTSSLIRKKYYKIKAPKNIGMVFIDPGLTTQNIKDNFFQTEEIFATGLQKNGVSLSDKPMKRVSVNLYTSLINVNTALAENTFTIDKGLAFLPGQKVYLDNDTTLISPTVASDYFNRYATGNYEGSIYVAKEASRNDPIPAQAHIDNPDMNYFPPRIATILSYDPQTGIIVFDRNFLAQTTHLQLTGYSEFGPKETAQNLILRIRLIFKYGPRYGQPNIPPPYNFFPYRKILCMSNQDILFFSSIDSEPTFNDGGIDKKIGFNYLILKPDTLVWELGRCKIQGEASPVWIKLASSNDKIENEKHNLIGWFDTDGSTAGQAAPSNPLVNRRYFAIDDSFYKKNFKIGDKIIFSYSAFTGAENVIYWGFHTISKLVDPNKTWPFALPPTYPADGQSRKALELYRGSGDGSLSLTSTVENFTIEKLYNYLDLDSIPAEGSWTLESGTTGALSFNKGPSGFLEGISSPGSGSILNTDKNIKIVIGPTGLGDFSNFPGSFTGFTGFTGGTGGVYTYESETIYYSLVTPINSEVERYKIDQFIKGLKGQGLWENCAFCLLTERQNKYNLNELLFLGGAIGVSAGLTRGGGYGASSWADATYNQQHLYKYESYTQNYMWSDLNFYANTNINSLFTRPKTFFTTYHARTLYPPNNYGQPVKGGQGLLKSENIDFYLGTPFHSDHITLRSKRNNNWTSAIAYSTTIQYGGASRPWTSYGFVVQDGGGNATMASNRVYQNGSLAAAEAGLPPLDAAILPSSVSFFGNGAEMSSSILFFSNLEFTNSQMQHLHNLYIKTAGALNGSIYNVETEAIKMYGF